MKFHGLDSVEKFEPGRPVYVLLHKDETHFAVLPDGSVDWSYSKADMDLREQILLKDFGTTCYGVLPLSDALVRFSNKQSELEKTWTPIIEQMRKTERLEDRFELYKKAKSKYLYHPISADGLLRRLLQID